MKHLLVFSLPFLLSACFSIPDKKEIEEKLEELKKIAFDDAYIYIDSRDTLNVIRTNLDSGRLEEKNSVVLSAHGRSPYSITGKYENYLKKGEWRYQTGNIGATTITYSPYAIGNFIKTNLPERGTTTVIDANTEKYHLTVKEDSITILFHADTLSARVKRRPYEDLIAEQMLNKGYKLSTTENKLLQDSSNIVSITSMKFVKGTERIFYKTAYAVMKNGYLAYAMQYGFNEQSAAEFLFDGVLTNLFLNGERFYYPFRKNETSESMESDSTYSE
ncbi:hypothetical protein [Pseudobacter ginsenosidimutans]|uniref:Lipoprotein n=1 Tax=Pseudobacter ginsenosidimutans TaxID=661488 RepID=A0A4Q7MKD8_9BACT|nr:hypothetical protein [Pseudobacter ginsenosidimutans]QEC45503.1 hypothetical protein FSB84_28835 [Pseudobacter ginsenosidimutans]RZS67039.1 hypothetical protein EV199_5423 [Pseudobacter ginsenosidimutans]